MYAINEKVRVNADYPHSTPFRVGDTVVVAHYDLPGTMVVRLPDPLTPEWDTEDREVDLYRARTAGGYGPGMWYLPPDFIEPLEPEPLPQQVEELPGMSDDLTSKADLAVAIANLERIAEQHREVERQRLSGVWKRMTRLLAEQADSHGFTESLTEVYWKANDSLPSWMHVWMPEKKKARYLGQAIVQFEIETLTDDPVEPNQRAIRHALQSIIDTTQIPAGVTSRWLNVEGVVEGTLRQYERPAWRETE